MLCQSVGKCADLGYCQEEGAVLHIGEVEQDFGALDVLRVTFTDLATQRITTLDGDVSGTEISATLDGFLPIPGHVYKVEVTHGIYGGGIFPVQIKPFEYDATAEDFDVTTTAYDHLLVKFVKNHNTTGIDTASEQWMSLPV